MRKADWSTSSRHPMPASDPASGILSAIIDVVPASRWIFARIGPKGELETVYGSHDNDDGPGALAGELRRQRAKSPTGPRIAATLGSLDVYASGVTLVFADARANFGILTLLRTLGLGSFTSSEISMLTFALDAVSDRLAALRTQPPEQRVAPAPQHEAPAEPTEGAFYVLNGDFQIVLGPNADDQGRTDVSGLQSELAERLPIVLEQTVRQLTATWSAAPSRQPGVAHPVPFLVVRTQPMSGPAGVFIGVRIDRFQAPNSLSGAAARFHISPRELQVLALLLDGNHLDQIAEQLHITSSTVQDHIKSMLDKTESRNRSELIARVLGWESTPSARRAYQ